MSFFLLNCQILNWEVFAALSLSKLIFEKKKKVKQ